MQQARVLSIFTEMAQPPRELPKQFVFDGVQLFKDQTLGTGAYGAVCKAKCDDLPCAAKILHQIFFQFNGPGVLTTVRKFEQECQFLKQISHPKIVQFLGTTRDRETGLPVLLMELMDESLTHFLEQSQEPLCYHTQVDLSYDIALALAYLHSNGILHRDLSSNNVLLIAGCRAKVTDFGMSKLIDVNPRVTPLIQCPGTLVYMAPEALSDPPVYTDKLDCFSHGVLGIQIMTRQFPVPGPRTTRVEDPRSPVGIIQMPVLENERRKSHIESIDPNHPLLPHALSCLQYRERDRPSAKGLCKELARMKIAERYKQSVQRTQEVGEVWGQAAAVEQKREKREIQVLTQRIQMKERENVQQLREVEAINQQLREELARATQRVQDLILDRDRQLRKLNEQLRANEEIVAEIQRTLLQKEIENRELQESTQPATSRHSRQQASASPLAEQSITRGGRRLQWRKCWDAPDGLFRGSAVVDSAKKLVYIRSLGKLYSYKWQGEEWSKLPGCPHDHPTLAVVDGLLTAVGGEKSNKPTNTLLSLVREGVKGKWKERLPPMPTKRSFTAVVSSGKHLVVIGGKVRGKRVATVEVMNSDKRQWTLASSLPLPLSEATAAVVGDNIYLVGAHNQAVLTCSLTALLQSCLPQSPRPHTPSVWQCVTDIPVYESTCVSFNGELVAVGGCDSASNPTDNVHTYNPATDSWNVINRMNTARRSCLAVVLPEDGLMVVGGLTSPSYYVLCSSVEIATCS